MLLRAFLLLFIAGLAFGQTGARFHRGDDLRWADPAFDDSGWELVAEVDFPQLEDFKTNRLWTRTRVVIPAGVQSGMVLRWCACEVYLNGSRVHAAGDLSAARPLPGHARQVVWLPADTPPGPALLAVRHYLPPGQDLISTTWRISASVLVGHSALLDAYRAAHQTAGLRVAVVLLMMIVAVATSLWGRPDKLGLLICGYLASAAFAFYGGQDWEFGDWFWNVALSFVIATPQTPLLLLIASMLAGIRVKPAWFAALLVFWVAVRGFWLAAFFSPAPPPWISAVVLAFVGMALLASGLSLLLLYTGWNRPGAPRALLLAAVLIQALYLVGRFGGALGSIAVGIPMFGSVVGWDAISRLLFGGLACALTIRRSRDQRAEEQRMKGELQAARTVQSMLLGQSLPAGVEAVYVPASEVGGDFYYAAETPEGTLVLVGDVSGKGLQAAMTVSAILGTLRGLSVYDPDQVLATLNRTLVGNAGFVTCCCVLVRNADLLVANAGHPAPYFDGVECAADSGLPLGVSAEAEWEVSRHARPAVITLLSDGVVEATNAAGELFGFERALAISRKPAKEIAQAAQAWGQEDDITVVTVR